MKKVIMANMCLLLAAMLWGSQIAFQKTAAGIMNPVGFYTSRCICGSLVMAIIVLFMEWKKRRDEAKAGVPHKPYGKDYFRKLFIIAPPCSLLNMAGQIVAQAGLRYTTASKAGFLTAIYVVFVPIVALIIFRQATTILTWLGSVMAVIGLYYLSMSETLTIGTGDLLIISSAIPFATHIVLLSKLVKRFQGVHFTLVEFTTIAIIGSIYCLIFRPDTAEQIRACIPSILYCGVLGVGVCYALQVTGQKYTDPTVAALIISLESVFAAVTGFLVLGESFTSKEFLGAVLIFASVIIAQIPVKPLGRAKGSVSPSPAAEEIEYPAAVAEVSEQSSIAEDQGQNTAEHSSGTGA